MDSWHTFTAKVTHQTNVAKEKYNLSMQMSSKNVGLMECRKISYLIIMTWFCLASIILELAAFAMANRCLK